MISIKAHAGNYLPQGKEVLSGWSLFFWDFCSILLISTKKLNQKIYIWQSYKTRSHWKCTSGPQKHMIFVCLSALFSCLLCFHVCKHVCFHLISNVHVVRTFENRIPFQTFEKWHNVSYLYVSYVKSETSDIWRTGPWFLKPFGESWGKPYLSPSKTQFYSKTRTVYRGCNVCYHVFFKNGKIDFKRKIWNFNTNFQT